MYYLQAESSRRTTSTIRKYYKKSNLLKYGSHELVAHSLNVMVGSVRDVVEKTFKHCPNSQATLTAAHDDGKNSFFSCVHVHSDMYQLLSSR